MNGRTPTRNPIADRTAIVLGFGLFLVPYGGGPFGFISGSDQHTAAWGLLLLVQTTFFLSVALGCAGMRLSARQGDGHQWKTAGTVGYVIAALIGLTTQPLLAGMSVQDETVVRVALSATTGLLYAPPFTFWVDRLRNLGKTSSHCGLTGVLILCYLLCPAVVAACSLLPIPYAYSVIQLACAVASASIQTFCFHYSQDTRSPESSRGRPDNELPPISWTEK